MHDGLREAVLNISDTLNQLKLKLTTAESCTGGGLSYWLTSVPGSSEWFERGFVTYSNNAKVEMLDVDPQTLGEFGAVSEQTAREMVEGALEHSEADLSIAITGIAGPDGGSPDKPVGTVWIAWANHQRTESKMYLFPGDRQQIRIQSMVESIREMLIFLKQPKPG